MTEIAYDDLNELQEEGIEPTHRIEGKWNLSVPFQVDTDGVKEILVNQRTETGYGVSKVFISPYQVVVYTDVPRTSPSPEEFSREDFEQWCQAFNDGVEDPEKPHMTYEQYMKREVYSWSEVTAFNQDGKGLNFCGNDYHNVVFAVKDLDIKELHIFLSDNEEEASRLLCAVNMHAAREKSVLEVTVKVPQ